MEKNYTTPTIEVTKFTAEDVMNGTSVKVDGWGDGGSLGDFEAE